MLWKVFHWDFATNCTSVHHILLRPFRYQDEIQNSTVRFYTAAVGRSFVLMDDNAQPKSMNNRRQLNFDNFAENEGMAPSCRGTSTTLIRLKICEMFSAVLCVKFLCHRAAICSQVGIMIL